MQRETKVTKGKLTDAWGPEIFGRVGEVTIAFAQLEWALFLAAKRIDGSMKLADFVKTHQKTVFDRLCDLILKSSKSNPALLAHVNEARALALRRHDLIHGVWSQEIPDGEQVLFRIPRKGDPYLVQIDSEEFGRLAGLIRRARNGLLKSSDARYQWPS